MACPIAAALALYRFTCNCSLRLWDLALGTYHNNSTIAAVVSKAPAACQTLVEAANSKLLGLQPQLWNSNCTACSGGPQQAEAVTAELGIPHTADGTISLELPSAS